jgi:hypothetical protein
MEPRVSGVGEREKVKRWTAGWRGMTLAGALVVIVIIGVVTWNFYFRPSFEPASTLDRHLNLPLLKR